ncbi:type III secretion protein (plasmid) [Pandoraea faecigallinarum]|uniref:Type III secretion protein n=1 Tax=Pandoraea faecigallinarum TaxID=656179 RepID=A0A0H3X369_9BURK|nr:type III secretion protein [Pandoraea faecigallinarum]AKM33398.1 type III secretion protein [Pandoraea faecigallinarum]
MDLQWQRRAELWLRLMDARGMAPAPHLAVPHGVDTHYLEQHAERAQVALSRPLPAAQRVAALHKLLGLLMPEAGGGVPLRAWLARGQLWLAGTAPPDSGAELWAELARQQRRLLDRVTEPADEDAQ